MDFQSTALPTELPSRFILCDAAPFSSGVPTMAQSRCRARPSIDVLIRFESYNRHLQKTISITNAPAAIGQYSQMVRTGGFFCTGQIRLNPNSGEIVPGEISARQTCYERRLNVTSLATNEPPLRLALSRAVGLSGQLLGE